MEDNDSRVVISLFAAVTLIIIAVVISGRAQEMRKSPEERLAEKCMQGVSDAVMRVPCLNAIYGKEGAR